MSAAARKTLVSSSRSLGTQQWRAPTAYMRLFYFAAHLFLVTAAHPEVQQSQPLHSAAVRWRDDSSGTSYRPTPGTPPDRRSHRPSLFSTGDTPLFHIVWPEEPLDLDTILRQAAKQPNVSWGKKVLAGRLSGLTVDEADDFCHRIRFAVEKHLRAVFDASTHYKVFEGVPTPTPFLHLDHVRDFLRSHFTRDKIKLSLPDRELEPLFKHAGGMPWKKITDGEHPHVHMHVDVGEDGAGTPQRSSYWFQDEL